MLEKIILTLPSTCTNSYEADLYAAAFSLAFHGLFRVGELTVHSRIPNNTVPYSRPRQTAVTNQYSAL